MIRAVIFDLDGVLVDSEEVNLNAAQTAFSQFGVELTQEDLRSIAGRHENDFLPLLAKKYGVKDLVALFEKYGEYYDSHWAEQIQLVPRAHQVISELRANGIELALATSQPRDNVRAFLDKFGLMGQFEVMVTQQDLVHRKPHPEIFERAVYRLAVPKDDTVVVDDAVYGVEAAHRAGLHSLALPNKYTAGQDFTKAEKVLSSLSELLDYLHF